MKRPDLIARNKSRATHGLSGTRVLDVWRHMMDRCYNPNDKSYRDYGARGIAVCIQWHDIKQFVADMGHPPFGLTLERINNDLGYSPENCRWASRTEQNNNGRRNNFITYAGVTLTCSQWEQRLGMKGTLLFQRLYKLGWPLEKAMTLPSREKA